MADYCTYEDVNNFLNLNTPISDLSKIKRSVVNSLIEQNEDYINSQTGNSWKTQTVTDERHEVNTLYARTTGAPIYLNHRNITNPLTKLYYWNGEEYENWLTDETEDRDSGAYWVDYNKGIIYINRYLNRPVNLLVSYTWGESSVPKDIKKACIMLTAIDILESEDYASMLPSGQGTNLNFSQKIDYWKEQIKNILEAHKEFTTIETFNNLR